MEARTESDIRPIHKPIRDIGFIGHSNIHTCGSRKEKNEVGVLQTKTKL